jgi:signal transduction histidine kinase
MRGDTYAGAVLTPGPATAPAPLTLWQQAWRIGAALLSGLLLWSAVVTTARTDAELLLSFVDLGVGLVAVVLLVWHRRAPYTIAIVTTVLLVVSASAVPASAIATISVATRRRYREVLGLLVIGTVADLGYYWLFSFSTSDLPWWVNSVIGSLGFGACVAIGFYIGARRDLIASYRDRAETAEREQAMRVVQAKANERARIAREMHDILAHRISLVAMHAGALAYRQDLGRDETVQTATIVRDNAHRALSDLRDVLGVLRDTDGNEASTRPQPTLVELDDLVRESETAGTPVRAHLEVDVHAVPETTARNAYRILQESLTNARKHAPGESVDLHLSGVPGGRLVLRVRNVIPAQERAADRPPALPSSGMGLMGLAERAQLSGGELTFGPTSQGWYVVQAWLPWAP